MLRSSFLLKHLNQETLVVPLHKIPILPSQKGLQFPETEVRDFFEKTKAFKEMYLAYIGISRGVRGQPRSQGFCIVL